MHDHRPARRAYGAAMHFDDRLATVLRSAPGSEAIARAQFRQLVDLLGTLPAHARGDAIDAAYLRLTDLAETIPASERAAILREPVVRLRSPRLVAQFAVAEPSVAQAAMARAELDEEQWLDLIPALPVRARGAARHRRGHSPRVEALLARLGVADRGLPSGEDMSAAAPSAAEPPPQIDEIGAIVRRIEAFRKTRQQAEHDGDQPQATDLSPRVLPAFDFATDADGRIVWAEAAIAPAAVGLRLGSRDPESPVEGAPELLAAFRHRQPIAGATLTVAGAPAVAGEWRINATPRFDQPGGRFVGYLGRMRRPVPGAAPPATAGNEEADRMRQILHELRTPVNAIQGFAEVIQQQLFGPTPHEYRALAATIASDGARMLAGFEELERLVRLDSGALALEPGACDLLPILSATIAQLDGFNGPRRSGLDLECEVDALPAAMARADAERLVWRLAATLAGATQPGEVLRLRARIRDNDVRLVLRLPAAFVARGEALFDTTPGAQPQALSAGMFGPGFALRLAAAEARAAGGSLDHHEDRLRLSLPLAGTRADPAPDRVTL